MKRALGWAASLAAAAAFLAPLLWMVLASFHTEATLFRSGLGGLLGPGGWTWRNYPEAWRRAGLGPALGLSLLQAALVAGGGLLVNSLAAYAFARLEFPGRDLLFAGVVVLIILPVEVLAVPMFLTARDLGLTGGWTATLAGLTVPFLAQAFNIYFLRQHFLSVPVELEEAAALDGAGAWRQYWSVALPSVRPALATVVLLDLLFRWGDFLWPLMLGTRADTRTVQIGLAALFTQPPVHWGAIMACAVLATLPVLVLFRWLQGAIVATDTRAGIK
jgi:ABC-type glycerol-3-phosphate transport system permease component